MDICSLCTLSTARVREHGLGEFYRESVHTLTWTFDTLRWASADDGMLPRMRRHMKEISEAYVWGKDAKPDSVEPEPRRST